ncbi:hypothetical protein [Brucella pseudogrignonensis]|uniref:hypothetical protein n=1 Tax=Brucella pseudogrignonensis TaxID=419475 RepID=UPI0038D12598
MAKQDITFANCDSTWQKRVMTAVLEASDTRPAAPVDGLERYGEDWDEGTGKLMIVELSCGEYVRFDQAEAVIAAERAAIPILKGTAFKSGDGWKDTTKEGEVCFVWNKIHPAPYALGQYPRVGKEHWSASTENFTFEPASPDEVIALFSDLQATNAALTARVKETEDCYLKLCEAIGVAATNAASIDASEKLRALETQLAAAEKARDLAVEWRDHDKDRAERYLQALERIAARSGIPMAGSFAAEVARAALEAKP